ncbi:Metallo-dependent phosphatase-like protein, partial [Suillus lakei]
TQYLFLGDYVDWGYFSIEVCPALTLNLLQLIPSYSLYCIYDPLARSGKHKYSERIYDACMDSFCALSLAAIMNKQFLCIHGGLSPELNNLDDIRAVHSFMGHS